MNLLVITQKVNLDDSNLGFFHVWLEKLARKVDKLIVICLEKGRSELPPNVKVLSLGKEKSQSKIKYLWNFYKYIFKYKNDYDGIFVHMNKEYILLGGLLWKLWNKKIALWYTHKAVSWQLRLAEKLVDKIFTASKESFRLPTKKVEIVGHGIPEVPLNYASIEEHEVLNKKDNLYLLSVGRIAPSKDWETVIRAVAELQSRKMLGLRTIMHLFAGNTIDQKGEQYRDELLKMGRDITGAGFSFNSYLPERMLNVYQNHHILIHTSRTGSMDKVVLEALAAGRLVVTSSEAYAHLAEGDLRGAVFHFPAGDHYALAKKIEEIYQSGALEKIPNQKAIDYVRKNHNLSNLIGKIINFYVA